MEVVDGRGDPDPAGRAVRVAVAAGTTSAWTGPALVATTSSGPPGWAAQTANRGAATTRYRPSTGSPSAAAARRPVLGRGLVVEQASEVPAAARCVPVAAVPDPDREREPLEHDRVVGGGRTLALQPDGQAG